ncbi:hypothetical protein COO91_07381 [Nostoc flagelliforme CCNUN1]|uniref:Uncharacterized protein n=1 Tax=Nostoc flagelliforme CCNUN1 TaxID=2038116 RepID=A0A2K8T148_9NOSO|nr:hypothetical protein COO91_07381 [Nostoc flagelliforme CCNUN1]
MLKILAKIAVENTSFNLAIASFIYKIYFALTCHECILW